MRSQTRLIHESPGTAHVVSVGTQGPAGPLGKSPFDLAREQGFTGSLDDFLDSLKGEPGDRGPAFEAGDAVAMTFNGDRAAIEYANGEVNEFPLSGFISGGSF